jgi:hypothetical protein
MAPYHFLSLPDAPEISWLGPAPIGNFQLKIHYPNIIHPSSWQNCTHVGHDYRGPGLLGTRSCPLVGEASSLPSSLRNDDIDISTPIPDTNGRTVPGVLERSALCDWQGKKCECHSLVPPVRVVGPFRDDRDEVPWGPPNVMAGEIRRGYLPYVCTEYLMEA